MPRGAPQRRWRSADADGFRQRTGHINPTKRSRSISEASHHQLASPRLAASSWTAKPSPRDWTSTPSPTHRLSRSPRRSAASLSTVSRSLDSFSARSVDVTARSSCRTDQPPLIARREPATPRGVALAQLRQALCRTPNPRPLPYIVSEGCAWFPVALRCPCKPPPPIRWWLVVPVGALVLAVLGRWLSGAGIRQLTSDRSGGRDPHTLLVSLKDAALLTLTDLARVVAVLALASLVVAVALAIVRSTSVDAAGARAGPTCARGRPRGAPRDDPRDRAPAWPDHGHRDRRHRRFPSARKLIGYVGLAPKIKQSGQSSRTGPLSKAGSKTLRWAAVEAAHLARRASSACESR